MSALLSRIVLLLMPDCIVKQKQIQFAEWKRQTEFAQCMLMHLFVLNT